MGPTVGEMRGEKQGASEVTGRWSMRRMTGAVGLAVAVLFAAGNALWALDQPEAGASAHQIVSFYTSTSSRIIAGASISLLAGALLVFFASGVRALLRDHAPDDLLPSAAFGGLLLVVATGLGAETINMAGALRAEHGQLTPELSRALFETSYVLGSTPQESALLCSLARSLELHGARLHCFPAGQRLRFCCLRPRSSRLSVGFSSPPQSCCSPLSQYDYSSPLAPSTQP